MIVESIKLGELYLTLRMIGRRQILFKVLSERSGDGHLSWSKV
jgi:hypothetical protein